MWRQAMNVEMEAMEKNKTWDLMRLQEGKKIYMEDVNGCIP